MSHGTDALGGLGRDHLWVDVAQDSSHDADDHLETRQGDRLIVLEECETQKPRSIGTRLCQIRMALRQQYTCETNGETYGLRYARPDPERRADVRLAIRFKRISLLQG
ncbi:hypothetical protein [Mesorhizobium sp. M0408]|uniref:hypothetical protein n=1 Tax=unclassified Mesorhizobium TaxID=325217 RepID=UPI003336F7B3